MRSNFNIFSNTSSSINLQYLIFLQTLLFALFADQVLYRFTPVILATHFEMLLILFALFFRVLSLYITSRHFNPQGNEITLAILKIPFYRVLISISRSFSIQQYVN